MAQCLMIVGDIQLTVTYTPVKGNDPEVVPDHLIQLLDQTDGHSESMMVTEMDAMRLIATFCIQDDPESTVDHLKLLWDAAFPSGYFNP